jgi:hypothetical protein
LLIREEVGLKIRRVCFLALALLCAAAFSPACGSAPQDTAPSRAAALSQPDCGASIDDALKAARAALVSKDAAHDHTALACLLAAMSALNAERLDVVRGNAGAQAHVLAVPKDSGTGP